MTIREGARLTGKPGVPRSPLGFAGVDVRSNVSLSAANVRHLEPCCANWKRPGAEPHIRRREAERRGQTVARKPHGVLTNAGNKPLFGLVP